MKIAQWFNTARIMGILYALFVLSLGCLIYIETRTLGNNWELFTTGIKIGVWQLFQCVIVGLMIEAWRQLGTIGTLSRRIAEGVYWVPRALWILIILFFAVVGVLFLMDGSTQIENVWSEVQFLALFLTPSIIMGIILAVAWRWEWVGTAIILLVTIFLLFEVPVYSFTLMLQWVLLYIVPLLLFAAVFWLNWRWHEEIRAVLRSEPIPLEQPAG